MTYVTDISSTPEFKAYEGTKEKLGGFDKMWNMLKKEAEKNPQYLSITIIDTEYLVYNERFIEEGCNRERFG
jgi:hypothetical protein